MKAVGQSQTNRTAASQIMRIDSDTLRILYVGCTGRSSRSLMAARAMSELGHDVQTVSSEALNSHGERCYDQDLKYRALSKLGFPPDRQNANEIALARLASETFDVLWISKSLSTRPKLLQFAKENNPEIKTVFHSEDDMNARHNQSVWFRQSLPLYDIVFTHKSYNANPEELPAYGARKVVMIDKCFDRNVHKPVQVDAADRERLGSAVGFVGTFELERAQLILRLAEAGIPVRVWGSHWSSWVGRHALMQVEDKILNATDYVKAIACTDINLGFLRRQNRDLQTDRSIEIPACGAFMLAERSHEHTRLFEEGQEAEFFADFEELRSKVEHYSNAPLERQSIGDQGRMRCIKSSYSFHDRLQSMLKMVMETPS
ncbi:MAG: spore maturation protein CgeB [Planctomycetota bacterium]|jgi:spore maturation protein CgeB